MNRMGKCAWMLAIMLIALVVLPAVALAVDVDSYEDLIKAIVTDKETEINITRDFNVTMQTSDWVRPRLPANCKLNGNGHTITLDYLYNGSNGNYLFYTNGNALIENITFDASNLRNGSRVASLASGDALRNVKIIGGGTMAYGVSVSGTNVKIDQCKFENIKTAIYTSTGNGIDTSGLAVTGSSFADCDYAVILREKNGVFSNNIVEDGKLNIVGENMKVSSNTFDGESRVKFYVSAKEFTNNKIMDESYIEFNNQNTTKLGETNSGNYYENFDNAMNKVTNAAAKEDALQGRLYTGSEALAATSTMPQTGDNSHLAFFAALLTLSAAGLLLSKKRSMSR